MVNKDNAEMPVMASMMYGSSVSSTIPNQWINNPTVIGRRINQGDFNPDNFHKQSNDLTQKLTEAQKLKQAKEPKVKEKEVADVRRIVQVFIADPDQNVPLEKALLFEGKAQMTDLTDQELFFEIDISSILKKHNEYRITLTDKSVKSKTVHLEPARIRDLKMTVVTIASF